MEQKKEFVLRALEPCSNVAALCREHGISRKTGHKWLERFKKRGMSGLEEMSRRPQHTKAAATAAVVREVLMEKAAHPRWGPKKIHVMLRRRKVVVPSVRTVARILEQAGEVQRRRRRTPTDVDVTSCVGPRATRCNEVWTVDFKGWWKTRDGQRAEPLTVRDEHSRFVLHSQLLTSQSVVVAKGEFERIFAACGLPDGIRIDNGSPFACTRARGGLSRLSAWWVYLGIRVLRGRPAHPQDNGGHERMHRDIAEDVESDASANLVHQQIALDFWRHDFNHVRPHEALGMKTPAEVYERPARKMPTRRIVMYPPTWSTRRVSSAVICVNGVVIRVGAALDGYEIGLELLDEQRARLWLYELDLGEISLLPRGPGYDKKETRKKLRNFASTVTSTSSQLSPMHV